MATAATRHRGHPDPEVGLRVQGEGPGAPQEVTQRAGDQDSFLLRRLRSTSGSF